MITRNRLLGQIGESTEQNWLIEAGAGFGKSVLLGQLQSVIVESLILVRRPGANTNCAGFLVELAAAARRSGHSETAAALSLVDANPRALVEVLRIGAKSLAIDDLHLWDDSVAAFISELQQEAEGRITIVLATRLLPPNLEGLRADPRWQSVSSSDLVMTEPEVEAVLAEHSVRDDDITAALATLSDGWPMAVATVAARMANSKDPSAVLQELGRHDSLIDGLLRTYLSGVHHEDLATARALAALPFFDVHIAETIGSRGVLDRLAAAGVPIAHRLDGWAEIAEQFRSALATGASTGTGEIEPAVVDHFLERGEVQTAIDVCLRTGRRDRAAKVLASLTRSQEARLDPKVLSVTMLEIGQAALRWPRCLYIHGHVCAMYGLDAEGLASLERCVDAFADIDPGLSDLGHFEASTALGIWRAFDGDLLGARRLLGLCETAADSSPPNVEQQANLHDLRGVIAYVSGTESELDDAVAELTAALDLWRRVGEPLAAASTVFRLVGGALVRRGFRAKALDLLDALPGFGHLTLLHTARLHLERASILPYVGRASEVNNELIEPRRIARLLGHDWIAERALVAEIVAAGIEADGGRVIELRRQIDELGYLVASDAPEGFRWGEITEAFARCELFDQASEALQRVRDIHGVPEWYLLYSQLTIMARSGDADRALRLLDELRLHEGVEASMRWNLDFLEACCHWRRGDHAAAEKALDQSYLEASLLGEPTQPTIVENLTISRMRSERSSSSDETVEICLFEAFTVSVNGRRLKVPAGQASSLIKVLVIGGGRLVVDQIIDPLWPDADMHLGRRRLRNVLTRIRQACGDIILRTDVGLQLAPSVSSDYQRALEAVEDAELPGAPDWHILQAIRLADLELLPDDRYEDWAELARQSLAARLATLHGLHADHSLAAGDLDAAVTSLARAQQLDGYGDAYIRRAIELLKGAGRAASAAALHERFSAVRLS